MATQKQLLESELKEVNTQLYASYKRIRELNERVADLEEEIKGTVELIAQADTNDALSNSEDSRIRLLVEDAKDLTEKLDLFNYWD